MTHCGLKRGRARPCRRAPLWDIFLVRQMYFCVLSGQCLAASENRLNGVHEVGEDRAARRLFLFLLGLVLLFEVTRDRFLRDFAFDG